MDRLKSLERQQQSKNTLRQYSVELGLRTHRPSALTPDMYVKHASSRSTTSNVSILPQFGDMSDWWEVPSQHKANYEQKTKPVKISYSAREIYNKAQLDKSVNGNFNKKREVLHRSSNKLVKDKTNEQLSSPGRLFSELSEHTIHTQPNMSSAATDFLYFTNYGNGRTVQPTARTSAWESQPSSPIASRAHSTWEGGYAKDGMDEIRFKTFEEAIRVYPSSDSECSADDNHYRGSSSNTKKTDASVDITSQAHNVENLTWTQTADVSAVRDIPGCDNDTPFMNSVVNRQTEQKQTENEEVRQLQQQLSSEDADIYHQVNHVSFKEVAPLQQPEDQVLKLVLENSFNESKENAAPQADVLDLEGEKLLDISLPDRTTTVPSNDLVPKIDLSELSPKKVKSPRAKKPITTNKSTSFASTKLRRSSPRNISAQSAARQSSGNKTKEIAEQIKRKVSANPKEIVREIKKRVQSRAPSSLNSQNQSMEMKWKNFLINTENLLQSVSQKSSGLQPNTTYDKFITMSPRIQSGELSVWSCLPDELWLHILSYLDKVDLYSFMMTCHDFNRLARDRSLWKILVITKKQLSDSEILKIGELRPSDLTIAHCTGTKLNGDFVTNHGLMTMFSSCGKALKHLSIASCVMPPLSGEALLHSAMIHCDQIIRLDISWCNITDRDVELVANSLPYLSSLHMSGNQAITDQSVKQLCDRLACQLCELALQGCFKITNDSLESLSLCSNLQHLNVGLCHKLSSSTLASAVKRLRKLVHLNMKGLKQVRDSCVTTIVKHCNRIERLNIAQCTGLTARTLTEISCALGQLTELDMALCKNAVNDTSVSCLLSNCKRIETLDLSSNPISNIVLSELATNCSSLRDLKINFCSVTETGVRQLLDTLVDKHCTLQLYGVKAINAQDLKQSYPRITILS